MPGWLDRLKGRAKAPAAGTPLLEDYPSYVAPHAGPPARWTRAQAQQNLEHLLAERPRRLAALGVLLQRHDIDIGPVLDGADPQPLLAALHSWALATWPALRGPRQPTPEQWLATTRAGPDIAWAMLLDLAILLGEIVVRRRATVRWGLDEDEDNGRDGMPSFMRPVLLVDRSAIGRPPLALDIEQAVVERFMRIDSVTERVVDRLAEIVTSALSGAYERA